MAYIGWISNDKDWHGYVSMHVVLRGQDFNLIISVTRPLSEMERHDIDVPPLTQSYISVPTNAWVSRSPSLTPGKRLKRMQLNELPFILL
jgi:hypothetical protein